MPFIYRDLPFSAVSTTMAFQDRHVPIKADQIIVWAGITERGQTECDPAQPFFPAILDIGHTHNFSIRVDHLIRWAGLDPRSFPKNRQVRVAGNHLPVIEADVWLKPNEPGKREASKARTPFRMQIDVGVILYSETVSHAPRLPLLGLRALRRAHLHLTIDGRRCLVNLRTTRRFWFF